MTFKSNLRQQGYDADMPSEAGRRIFLTPEKIRQMAHDSKDGGRAMCEICHESFAMYYIRLAKIKMFQTGHVCLDCQREHKFQLIK